MLAELEPLKKAILDRDTFHHATLSGRRKGHTVSWKRVTLRPVEIKGVYHIQFSHFDGRQDITQNYADEALLTKLDEVLALPFRNFTVQTTKELIQIQVSKKGKVFINRDKHTQPLEKPDLSHDHEKERLLELDLNDPFLQAVGITSPDGKLRTNMYSKYRQINEFLRMIVETHALDKIDHDPLSIIDCGCGSAYLTFAIYHYLNEIANRPAVMLGVDYNAKLLEQRAAQAKTLGWNDISFHASTIIDFETDVEPDIVVALHACDTATDEALLKAILWNSRLIFSAPCCHHHLQVQLDNQPVPEIYRPVLRHGILKERLGDVLTDSFRAQLLRIMGYRTEVIEFIAAEHTDKNLMIRAVRTTPPGDAQAIAEYLALKAYWNVTPWLETLLIEHYPDMQAMLSI